MNQIKRKKQFQHPENKNKFSDVTNQNGDSHHKNGKIKPDT